MTWHRQHQHGRMVLQHPLVNLHQRTPGWCNSTAGVPTTPDESQCTFRHTSANSLSCPPAPNPPQGRSSRGSPWFVVDINITAWQLYSGAFDLSKRQVLLSSAHLWALHHCKVMPVYFNSNEPIFSLVPSSATIVLCFPLIYNTKCSTFCILLCSAQCSAM